MGRQEKIMSFKIRRIESKEINSEKIDAQVIHKMFAEEATEGLPKVVFTSDSPFAGFVAGAHIKVSIINDQTALREFNEVTKGESDNESPMKKDLSEMKIKEAAKKLAFGERKAVKPV